MKKESPEQTAHSLRFDAALVLSLLFSIVLLSAGAAYAIESTSSGSSIGTTSTAAQASTGTSVASTATPTDSTTGPTIAEAATSDTTVENKVLTPQGATTYDVWVGGVQVTSANMNDVLDNGAVTYTPATATEIATLTLTADYKKALSISGVASEHHGAAIASTGDLRILLRNTTTITGASCSTGSAAGIYVDGDLILGGTGTVNATAGSSNGSVGSRADFSAGILATGTVTLCRHDDGNNTYINATGGPGASKSAGIAVLKVLNVTNDAALVARGADNPGADSMGVYAGEGLTFTEDINGDSSVKAYGGAGANSYGVLVERSGGVTASSYATLLAQAGNATGKSIGIKLANVDDSVSLSEYANLTASSGTTPSTSGTSEGIYGTLVYDATGKSTPTVTVTCGTGKTSAALAAKPEASGTYRWVTDAVSNWQYSVDSPLACSGSEKSVSLATIDLGVYIAGTEVTMVNKDNALAGTANDGRVRFVPSSDPSSLGTLFIDG